MWPRHLSDAARGGGPGRPARWLRSSGGSPKARRRSWRTTRSWATSTSTSPATTSTRRARDKSYSTASPRSFDRGDTVYDPWHYVPVLVASPAPCATALPSKTGCYRSGACFASPHSPWSPPLAPPAPQRIAPPCSPASQLRHAASVLDRRDRKNAAKLSILRKQIHKEQTPCFLTRYK